MVVAESTKDNNDEMDIGDNAHHHTQGYTKRFLRNRIQTDFSNVLPSVTTYEMGKNVILTSFYTGMMVVVGMDSFHDANTCTSICTNDKPTLRTNLSHSLLYKILVNMRLKRELLCLSRY